jgi:hypothetical protein
MKIKNFAAIIAALTVIVILSCNWFNKKKHEPENPLVGNWRIDSLQAGKDSTEGLLLLLMAKDALASARVQFTSDSFFITTGDDVDTSAYQYDDKTQRVFVKDSTGDAFDYHRVNDSTITLTGKDSLVFVLTRK